MRAARCGQRARERLANDRVHERVASRRPWLAGDQPRSFCRIEHVEHSVDRQLEHLGQERKLELAAAHGGRAEDRPRTGTQRSDAERNHVLDTGRGTSGARFLAERRFALEQLLDEERIAARPIAQRPRGAKGSAAGGRSPEHCRDRGRVDSV